MDAQHSDEALIVTIGALRLGPHDLELPKNDSIAANHRQNDEHETQRQSGTDIESHSSPFRLIFRIGLGLGPPRPGIGAQVILDGYLAKNQPVDSITPEKLETGLGSPPIFSLPCAIRTRKQRTPILQAAIAPAVCPDYRRSRRQFAQQLRS